MRRSPGGRSARRWAATAPSSLRRRPVARRSRWASERTAAPGRGRQASALRSRPMHRPAWIHGPGGDAALALCWVPFAVAVVAVQGHRHLLAAALSGVLLLSLSHQPVTLALVYG